MADPLDLGTLLIAYGLIRILQAIGLVYVWRIHRKYVPARNWAIGSVMIASGALLIASRSQFSSASTIIAGNLFTFTGIFVFNAGVVQACMGKVPWRVGSALIITALVAQAWFTVWAPLLAARIVVLTCVIVICNGYAAASALRAPRGPLRGTQSIIAVLLILQASTSLISAAVAVQSQPTSILESAATQSLFVIFAMAIAFLLAFALATLTSQRITTLFEATINHMNHGVAMFDDKQKLIICNDRYGQLYGLTSEQVRPGTSLQEIKSNRVSNGIYAGDDPDDYRLDRAAPETVRSELRHLNDGRSIAVSHRPIPSGGWVTTHEDVTDRQRAEAKIAFMARHDLLTGLANRAFLLQKLDEALARLRRSGEAFAVLMLDLDQFKEVNDCLGHPAGDALLRETARRLKASLRETDTLARFGGDEFAIIQTQIAEPREAAITLAHRIIDAIGEPYNIEGNRVNVTTSIGIATAPQDGSDHNELIKKADLALYSAKAKGRNGYRFFDAEMAADLNTRQQLENELRNALVRHELELHYQLIIDVNTQMPHGAEALLRWSHPQRGLLSADQFIPLAEETGLIIPLSEWVLHKACAEAAAWPTHIKLAVNLSPVQFRKYNLLDVILSALVESGLAPDRLEVEVTEQLLLENEAEHLAVMHQLKNIGVSIVLDDFGTGYSSLSCLTMFPFDKIKIDKFFTHNLTKRAECAAIISSVMALADGLNTKTVAEGVETKQQFEILSASGVNFVQGFLFGRPCPASALEFNRVDDVIFLDQEPKGATLHDIEVVKKALAS